MAQVMSIMAATKVIKEEFTVLIQHIPISMTSKEFTAVRLNLIITLENYGHFGGAAYIKNCAELDLREMEISSNLAFQGGSFFVDYSEDTEIRRVYIFVENQEIYDSKSISDGGFIYINGPNQYVSLQFFETTIENVASNVLNLEGTKAEGYKTENLLKGGGVAFIYSDRLLIYSEVSNYYNISTNE